MWIEFALIFPGSVDTLFLATISAGELPVSGEQTIVFDSARINPGFHYNTATGVYTAPADGYYQ